MAYVAPFDLWYILVEVVFGSVILAWVGVTILLFIIGAMSRMSVILLSSLVMLFSVAYFTGYYGPLFLLFAYAIAMIYAFSGMLNFISRFR